MLSMELGCCVLPFPSAMAFEPGCAPTGMCSRRFGNACGEARRVACGEVCRDACVGVRRDACGGVRSDACGVVARDAPSCGAEMPKKMGQDFQMLDLYRFIIKLFRN